MRRRAFLAVAVVAASGCLEVIEDDEEAITEPEDIVIVEDGLGRDDPGTEDERVYVYGVIRNEGDRQLRYLEVEATFLDGEGEELDTVIEHVEDVTSGEEWSFEVEYPRFGEDAARVADYDLEPTTGL
ncbi:FxLYD domain-containing protein [Natrialbaceae archaeon A-gly3]